MTLAPALPGVPRPSAWIGTVERGDFTRGVRGPGNLVPRVIRWIPAASGGRVERIVAKPGIRVEADTMLVELQPREDAGKEYRHFCGYPARISGHAADRFVSGPNS